MTDTEHNSQAVEEARSAAQEFSAEASHVRTFIMGWIDDQAVFHWRSGGSTFTCIGIVTHLGDLARKAMLDTEAEEDNSELV